MHRELRSGAGRAAAGGYWQARKIALHAYRRDWRIVSESKTGHAMVSEDFRNQVRGLRPDDRAHSVSADFLGDNVSVTLTDHRDGRRYAALDHGHFGVKLHRSTATGWEEIAAPTYPPKPEGYEETDM